MWSWNRRGSDTGAGEWVVGGGGQQSVGLAEPAPCHAILVLHADGVLACAEGEVCRAEPDLHVSWVPCSELASPCGCMGDEHPHAGEPGAYLGTRAA